MEIGKQKLTLKKPIAPEEKVNLSKGGIMRHVQYTLSDDEFLLLRSVCVVANTSMKSFSRLAVLEHMRNYLKNPENTKQLNQPGNSAQNISTLKEI